MDIKIGKIEEKDIRQAYQFCIGIFKEFDWDRRFIYGLKDIKEFFSGSKEVFFIAKKGKKIVACAGIKRLSETNGLIKRFYVAKEFRGKGLAEIMFNRIKRFAKKEGYKTLVLDIFADNIRAKKFFQKQGLRIFKHRSNKKWRESQSPKLFEFRKLNLK